MADIDLDLTEAELFLFQTTQFMFKDLITMWKNLQMRVYYKFFKMILLLHTNGWMIIMNNDEYGKEYTYK